MCPTEFTKEKIDMPVKEIIKAIKEGNCEELVRIFHDHPEQVNAYTFFAGKTWLGYAAGQGKIKSVQALVDLGLDINQGCKRENVTPICDAAGNGHLEIVQYLLNRGAELNVSSPLENPLIWAVADWNNAEDTKIVEALLKAGIDTNVTYKYTSRTNKKEDLDVIAKAFQCGTPVKAGVIASWNAKGNSSKIEEILNNAMAAADSHEANYNYGEKKLAEMARVRAGSLEKAMAAARDVCIST